METAGNAADTRIQDSNMIHSEEDVIALTNLFINEYLYTRVIGVDEGSNLRLWLLSNNWLEKINPVNYKPEVAGFLLNLGVKKIWEVDLPVEILIEVISKPLLVKVHNNVLDQGELEVFARRLTVFISKLSGLERRVVYSKLKEICSIDPDCYLYTAVLALTISTNI